MTGSDPDLRLPDSQGGQPSAAGQQTVSTACRYRR